MCGPKAMGRVKFFRIVLPARTRLEVEVFPNNSADHIRTVPSSVGGRLPKPCQRPPMTSLPYIRHLSPVSVRPRNTIAHSAQLFHPHRSLYSSSSSSVRRPHHPRYPHSRVRRCSQNKGQWGRTYLLRGRHGPPSAKTTYQKKRLSGPITARHMLMGRVGTKLDPAVRLLHVWDDCSMLLSLCFRWIRRQRLCLLAQSNAAMGTHGTVIHGQLVCAL
jgi:hypothetical protein